jgi:hypothetical protein
VTPENLWLLFAVGVCPAAGFAAAWVIDWYFEKGNP